MLAQRLLERRRPPAPRPRRGWPPAAVPGGRQRSAALGTRSASGRWSVMMRSVAVMPGSRRPPALGAVTTTV